MTTPLARHIPALAAVLCEKPTTLYERQRELLREGLLQALPGRGRGSGVQATPEAVAMVLCSMMASLGLSGSGPRTRAIAEAITPSSNPICKLTGTTRFVDAITRILSDETVAARVREIRVTVSHRYATIEFDKKGSTTFVDPNRPEPGSFGVVTNLWQPAIRALAATVKDLTASNTREQ
jgi:hypothetical protein